MTYVIITFPKINKAFYVNKWLHSVVSVGEMHVKYHQDRLAGYLRKNTLEWQKVVGVRKLELGLINTNFKSILD